MLRDRIRPAIETGTAVVATMQSGALVSDEVVNGMVEERLSAAGCREGVYPGRIPADAGSGRAPVRRGWTGGDPRGGDSPRG